MDRNKKRILKKRQTELADLYFDFYQKYLIVEKKYRKVLYDNYNLEWKRIAIRSNSIKSLPFELKLDAFEVLCIKNGITSKGFWNYLLDLFKK